MTLNFGVQLKMQITQTSMNFYQGKQVPGILVEKGSPAVTHSLRHPCALSVGLALAAKRVLFLTHTPPSSSAIPDRI